MTVTTLDPVTALVVVDLQRGIAEVAQAAPVVQPVIDHAVELAAAFRAQGLPVVLVNANGAAPGRTERPRGAGRPPGWDEVLPELGDGIRVTKQTWGAFHGTDLDARLRALEVTQVVLTGVVTSKGVESTARAAFEHGYNVTVATDAIGDLDRDAHLNAVTRIFPALGETGTMAEILSLLAANTR